MRNKFSCIIPFYNEGIRVLPVVKAISKVQLINQIICVDGGSSDNVSSLISKRFPRVELVVLKQKGGKAEDVSEGLKKVKYNNLLLLDGDLQNVNAKEIGNYLRLFLSSPKIDMIILKQKGGNNWLDRIQRKEIIFSGNRIMHKSDLVNIMNSKPKGYRLEVVANQYMLNNKKEVRWIESSIWNYHKIKKWGLWEGLIKSFSMELDLFLFLGSLQYFKQVFTFCKTELKIR